MTRSTEGTVPWTQGSGCWCGIIRRGSIRSMFGLNGWRQRRYRLSEEVLGNRAVQAIQEAWGAASRRPALIWCPRGRPRSAPGRGLISRGLAPDRSGASGPRRLEAMRAREGTAMAADLAQLQVFALPWRASSAPRCGGYRNRLPACQQDSGAECHAGARRRPQESACSPIADISRRSSAAEPSDQFSQIMADRREKLGSWSGDGPRGNTISSKANDVEIAPPRDRSQGGPGAKMIKNISDDAENARGKLVLSAVGGGQVDASPGCSPGRGAGDERLGHHEAAATQRTQRGGLPFPLQAGVCRPRPGSSRML